MTNYIKLTNGTPAQYSIARLRADHPDTSYPAEISEAVLAEHGVYVLHPRAQPGFEAATQRVIATAPAIDPATGQWTEVWSIVALTEDEQRTRRATLVCSRLQGRLTLGAAVCAALDAMAVDPATPWAMRETITGATEWRRSSQTIDEMGYLLGYDAAQMDALFEAAMQIEI
jgi:hypothetical protein